MEGNEPLNMSACITQAVAQTTLHYVNLTAFEDADYRRILSLKKEVEKEVGHEMSWKEFFLQLVKKVKAE